MTEPQPLPMSSVELAGHLEFVRRVAHALVRDAAAAEDLAQDAWVAALERPGTLRGSLRAWLAVVLRNRAALALRRGDRRQRREREREHPGPETPTAEIVERMELHGRVVAAVLELPEPYREVVLLRYFRDESPAGIAARLGLPEPTVRTRLARAQERLRQRLDAHFGGERARALVCLADLARSGLGEPASSLEPLSPAITALAMKKTLAAVAVALLALVAVWSVSRGGTPSPLAEERVAERPLEPPAQLATSARAPEPMEVPVDSRAPAAGSAPPAPRPPEPAPSATPPVAGHQKETAWLEFHVRDPRGNPIPEAKVSLTCYRTREDPGSSTSYGELMPTATSDPKGVARLEYPRRLEEWNHPEQHEVGTVCYTIAHPDFVAIEEWSLDVSKGPVEVVLRHGALLIVAGFVGDRSTLLTDVQPHLTDEVSVEPSDWVPVRDGRPSCNRLPPGRHALYLTRKAEGGTWASAVVEFELAEEEVRELTLELQASRRWSGTLDPRVPRPVANGEVLLNLYVGNPDRSGPKALRTYGAPVDAGGNFTLDGLPPGRGEIIGMCEGWVSSRPESVGEDALELQQVDPSSDEPFVLAMEPTARLELLVLDPDGKPVEGAQVHMWPNVHWSIGYAQMFLEREWQALTDAAGRAEIVNIPAGNEHLAIAAEGLCLPRILTKWGSERRHAEATLIAGETTTLELRLETCEE